MKALILAAGFGTRLAPFTHTLPKPLFTLAGRTVLGRAIEKLAACGCTHIFVNTHHLHRQVEGAVEQAALCHDAHIQWVHEPEILDTGGAIANIRSLLGGQPFFVVNADIVSDIDLRALHAFHCQSDALATLALHNRAQFNMVVVDPSGWIQDFRSPGKGLAFTGIQVISPEIFNYFPDRPVFSSIEVYQSLCNRRRIKAFVPPFVYWEDIGTPAAYRRTARQWIAARALQSRVEQVDIQPIAGDGSDRTWFRATGGARSPVVLSDHGICLPGSEPAAQLNAFVKIGRHLHDKGLRAPRILCHDTVSGLAAVEDLGTTHLADVVKSGAGEERIVGLYQQVIDHLIRFCREGIKDFNPAWTCQTQTYNVDLILEKECRYFLEAFVCGHMGRDADFEALKPEFLFIAGNALQGAFQGLMHRDFQSRNIMVKNGKAFFIDFQSARQGPLQYDLASLLIDPYVKLNLDTQNKLLAYALDRMGTQVEQEAFLHSYRFCCLTRNLQILGAFAFLSRVKGKKEFARYIPAALASLKDRTKDMQSLPVNRLTHLINTL